MRQAYYKSGVSGTAGWVAASRSKEQREMRLIPGGNFDNPHSTTGSLHAQHIEIQVVEI